MTSFWCENVYLGSRWASNVAISVSKQGIIQKVTEQAPKDGEVIAGPVLPAMPNLHSHAFQRAMAGLAEHAEGEDNFWSWRQEMYRLAKRITPELYLPLARYLFIEMLEAGYGSVAEFHYLHGKHPKEMIAAIMEAGRQAGIRLTMIPVFYAHSDFGGKPLDEGQNSFYLPLDRYAKLFQSIKGPRGLSFHSLRAATIDEIKELLKLADSDTLIHTHISEQKKEVRDCMAMHRRRPIDYLTDHVQIDKRWTFIHATHVSEDELTRIVLSNAVIGLCPTTESNLGDGFFKAMRYRRHKGKWGIGTDSHVTLDPAQELRTLEYHQRLNYLLRNLLHGKDNDVAGYLYSNALVGGARALGQKLGQIAPGYKADFIVLDNSDPMIASARQEVILARAIFACRTLPVKDVYIGGKALVTQGKHVRREKARRDFLAVLQALH